MHLGDQRHDVLGLAGDVRLEPFAEQRLQLVRQPERDIAGRGGAGLPAGGEDILEARRR